MKAIDSSHLQACATGISTVLKKSLLLRLQRASPSTSLDKKVAYLVIE